MKMLGPRTFAAACIAALAPALVARTDAHAKDGVTTLSDGTLKVCMFIDVPPLAKQVAGDDWVGWDVDFLSGFAASLGLEFEPMAFDYFAGLWKKPGEGVCDITGGAFTDTEARRKDTPEAVWSDDYLTVQRSFIVRDEDRDALDGVADLADRTVIVWPESAGAIDLQRRIDNDGIVGVTTVYAKDVIDALESVRDGKAFAFGWDSTSARYQAAQYPGLAVTWLHPMMSEGGSEANEQYAYIVREADAGLVEALNAYIAENRATYGWPD
jgi:ABC-type amino acid transport substrate-binding protein